MKNVFEIRNNYIQYSHIKSHLLYGDYSKCKEPTVSILMPIYNHPDYFKEALLSAINQNYQSEYEIVVVDNNDFSDGINLNQQIVTDLNTFNVFYYRNEKNIGGIGNFNRCVELARSPFVTYCHDDDTLLPTTLSTLMSLQKRANMQAIIASRNEIDNNSNLINQHRLSKKYWLLQRKDWYPYTLLDLFISSPSNGGGCLYTRKNLLDIGGHSEDFAPSSDYALHINYTYKYGSIFSNIQTYNYRIAENDSFAVYNQCLECDKHFRKCIIEKLSHFKWILNRILIANCNISKIKSDILWGKKDKSLLTTIRFSDKLIMKFVWKLLSIKKYTISIK
jgi:glycosyltransferase involved in cell wall biosynthesis